MGLVYSEVSRLHCRGCVETISFFGEGSAAHRQWFLFPGEDEAASLRNFEDLRRSYAVHATRTAVRS
jgi:hypothetical protein